MTATSNRDIQTNPAALQSTPANTLDPTWPGVGWLILTFGITAMQLGGVLVVLLRMGNSRVVELFLWTLVPLFFNCVGLGIGAGAARFQPRAGMFLIACFAGVHDTLGGLDLTIMAAVDPLDRRRVSASGGSSMPARRTRQEARDRLRQVFEAQLDRLIPADAATGMKGRTFLDFEMQGVELKQALLPTLLEELAALSPEAQVAEAGRCPHCGSERTYLEPAVVKKEVRSPDGPVVLERQQGRCRACGGSFSPSGS